MLDEGVTSAATAREALGIGRRDERAGMTSDALACFARAADMGPGARTRCMRAVLLRRLRPLRSGSSYGTGSWISMTALPASNEKLASARRAHEHRLQSSVCASSGDAIAVARHDPARREAIEHRVARLIASSRASSLHCQRFFERE